MTRIEQARRRVTVTRYALGIGAAAALAAFAAVARSSHPATHSLRSSGTTVTSQRSTETSDDSTFFGDDDSGSYSNIGPSGSAQPQVQSGAS
jgi:ferric-dicitrate binding protein FerR (iron transport regulator)